MLTGFRSLPRFPRFIRKDLGKHSGDRATFDGWLCCRYRLVSYRLKELVVDLDRARSPLQFDTFLLRGRAIDAVPLQGYYLQQHLQDILGRLQSQVAQPRANFSRADRCCHTLNRIWPATKMETRLRADFFSAGPNVGWAAFQFCPFFKTGGLKNFGAMGQIPRYCAISGVPIVRRTQSFPDR